MASLRRNQTNGQYLLVFRFGGRQYQRSLKTNRHHEAMNIRGRVEETIALLERGRLEMPRDADPGAFILSDGKIKNKSESAKPPTLKEVLEKYQETLLPNVKEDSTIKLEKIHIGHLNEHLRNSSLVQTLTVADLQAYVARRAKQKWRSRPIGPATIKKEVATFRLIWNWAQQQKMVNGPPPTNGLLFPKLDEKPPFMTRAEIERTIERTADGEESDKSAWECLFLESAEVSGVLDVAKEQARQPFVYPMFVFVAHTGARRSELLRSEVDDFDFESRMVRIREKKRSRKLAITYRFVPMSQLLAETMQEWFSNHPGGKYTLSQGLHGSRKQRMTYGPLTTNEATDHFKRTLKSTKWQVVRGFHIFRHSFASNAAAAGVDQRIIDEWMGHQTDEMRRRYRHLFPQQQHDAMESVFSHAAD